MTGVIPYGRQDISEADIQTVVDVLRSDFLTQGPAVPSFEKSVADYCSAQHAVAVNSATSALHIACLALEIGPNDVVWTTPVTFVASANCALYCEATVDFIDIDPLTYNMSMPNLAEKLLQAEQAGKLPKVVIPVHLCGQSCDMASLYALGQKYGFKIIEDASHAIGGKYRGKPIGNCCYSDITVFSFHPVKIITTGEGGMAITNDAGLAKKMELLRCHGITSDAADMHARPPEEIWNYQQIELGFNYRMTDIQAALGLSQMQRLDVFISKRHDIARRYDEMLDDLPVMKPWQHADSYSSFHLYPVRLKLAEIKKTHRQVYEEIRAQGILVNLHYIPVYLQPYYEKMGFREGYCPEAERYYSEAISIPMYPTMSETQQDQVVEAMRKAAC
ncbi:UDP-4-amino-4,6-dideoxy-N-acetyl-beta-L-altrosamine transaminase [Mariprofundus sp. NF]|uniref:UDP-4-amino-4, 6-dideoxy-N-acetyl-beta-L-altrosamine transaminase n=1 Tax=Mariprofundus sp. NF TaxID=2608716 RepID=UPI00159FA826|nr:UDP-4-amino-4,6-dideoxy-N-acetyl-beta-L-altrosamine transaminase [Mariprofundus sp. NF]NWF37919.1 UDP-4-amino-4,6-dideoxy-N-acetyl-beta-L-altrosamine transaminase [Mariprofundus sp. NF]